MMHIRKHKANAITTLLLATKQIFRLKYIIAKALIAILDNRNPQSVNPSSSDIKTPVLSNSRVKQAKILIIV